MRRFIIGTVFLSGMFMLVSCAKKQTVNTKEPTKPQAEVVAAAPASDEQNQKIKVEFKAVYFDLDSYAIRDDAKPLLVAASKALAGSPSIKLTLGGHCDERGTAEYNLALGDKRANAVKEYLINLGVHRSRLTSVSYGKEQPVSFGHDENSWSRNRRVEFIIQ
jgi:peptidoglycan-associated lipoprotein